MILPISWNCFVYQPDLVKRSQEIYLYNGISKQLQICTKPASKILIVKQQWGVYIKKISFKHWKRAGHSKRWLMLKVFHLFKTLGLSILWFYQMISFHAMQAETTAWIYFRIYEYMNIYNHEYQYKVKEVFIFFLSSFAFINSDFVKLLTIKINGKNER